MKRTHGPAPFSSMKVESQEDGYVGQELHCDGNMVAKIIYWDADGQFAVETMGELPLVVLEELITETRLMVRMR